MNGHTHNKVCHGTLDITTFMDIVLTPMKLGLEKMRENFGEIR